MIKLNQTIHTNGKGYWSNCAKAVRLRGLEVIDYSDDDDKFGELRVYFDKRYWNVKKDGLIYTDTLFLKELKKVLESIGLSTKVNYSEQGMQGDDYVSLDVGQEFLKSWFMV